MITEAEAATEVSTNFKWALIGYGSTKVFVSNLAFESNWRSLKDHMRKAGEVIRADIFEDEKGRSRGMG